MYTAITFIFAILALLFIVWGARVLLRGSWVLGFLRGATGLSLIAGALFILTVAADIYSYKHLLTERSIATVSFVKTGEQEYLAKFADEDGLSQSFTVLGDQWQIDARMLKWKGPVAGFGVEPAYRLDRLSGRYLTLQDEREKAQSVHALVESDFGVDVWSWVKSSGRLGAFADAEYGSATFLPMEDGAVYDVRLSQEGLAARPLNNQAKRALGEWD